MAWCEANHVDYLFGLARNERLQTAITTEMVAATLETMQTGKPARRFKDFAYTTLDSWSRERRVVGKAEVTGGEANPRFVVTSLKPAEAGAQHLYEKIYCARGEMENRIKECKLDLFADATCGTIRLKLLKLGVLVRASVRRIKIDMASACPWQVEFALAHARLRNAAA